MKEKIKNGPQSIQLCSDSQRSSLDCMYMYIHLHLLAHSDLSHTLFDGPALQTWWINTVHPSVDAFNCLLPEAFRLFDIAQDRSLFKGS